VSSLWLENDNSLQHLFVYPIDCLQINEIAIQYNYTDKDNHNFLCFGEVTKGTNIPYNSISMISNTNCF